MDETGFGVHGGLAGRASGKLIKMTTVQTRGAGRRDLVLIGGFLAIAFAFWAVNTTAFVAEDSYFYMVVIRNLVFTGQQTYNGLFPTNGLHPLWLYLAAGYSYLVSLVNPGLLYRVGYALPLSALLVIGGAVNFYRAAPRLGINPLLFVSIPLCYLTVLGVLYSEAHMLYFSLSLLTRLAVEGGFESRGRALLTGVVAAMVFLSRLDAVFLVGCFFIWFMAVGKSRSRVVVSALVCGAISGAYVLSNEVFFGGAVPISGWLKSSFPHLYMRGFEYWGNLRLAILGYYVAFGLAPLIFSMFAALLCRKWIRGPRTVILAFLGGVALHFLHVALFVKEGSYWYWYYVIPVILGTMSLCYLLEWAAESWPRASRSAVIVLSAAVFVLSTAALFIDKSQPNTSNSSMKSFSFIRDQGWKDKVILTSESPGLMAFFTDNHIIAADMLTSNRVFYQNMENSPNALEYIIDYCRERGKPVDYLVWNQGPWFLPRRDLRAMYYFSPKKHPEKVVIGKYTVGDPIYKSFAKMCNLIVWDLSSLEGTPPLRDDDNPGGKSGGGG